MSLSFNRDLKLLVTANPEPYGYSVFHLDDSICEKLFFHKGKRVYLIGCIPGSQVGYIVWESQQKQLLMCDFEKDIILNMKLYAGEILALKISAKYLVVILHDKICIHNNFEDLNMGRYEHMPRNLNGIGALAEEAPYFAYPWYRNAKDKSENVLNAVQIMKINKIPRVITLTIYQNELPNIAAIGLNKTGKLIAIANTDGQLIRVYEVNSGHMIIEYFRGLTRVSIVSLWFSACEKYLVVSSNINVLHIFVINQEVQVSPAQIIFQFLPKEIQDKAAKMLIPKTSYATVCLELEQQGTGSIFEIITVGTQTRLLVATPSGNMHVYNMPKVKGACQYHSTFNLQYHCRNRPMVTTFPSSDRMRIDNGSEDPARLSSLMGGAATSVSTAAASALTSSAGGSNFTMGASTSGVSASTSAVTAAASTSITIGSSAAAGASMLAAGALSFPARASSSVTAAVSDASNEENASV